MNYNSDTVSHCAFSSNLFHRQIVQKHIKQLNSPEDIKWSPWKVFGVTPPPIPRLLSLDARLSQHYICQKIIFCHFSNFCRKKFPGLIKKFLHIFYNFVGCNLKKLSGKTSSFIQWVQEISTEIWKMTKFHFWADVMLRQPHVWVSGASPAQKSMGLKVFLLQKLFKSFILLHFWVTYSVGKYIFVLFACETNGKKKHSAWVW